jgi:DNA polymerase-4
MPISTAARLCPHGNFVPVDMAKYRRVSTEIMAILDEFSPLVEPISVDEAFIDLTGTDVTVRLARRCRAHDQAPHSRAHGPQRFRRARAQQVPREDRLDLEKPDGLVVVAAGGEAASSRRSRSAACGCGQGDGRGAVRARDHDDRSAAAHAARRPDRRFGPHGGELHDLAFGRDDRPVEPYTAPKSMGAEETFEADCRDPARLASVLREQAERVARELREGGVAAARLTLKLRYSDFHTITRAVTAEPTQDGLELYRRARTLLDREHLDQPVRSSACRPRVLDPRRRTALTPGPQRPAPRAAGARGGRPRDPLWRRRAPTSVDCKARAPG